MALKLNPAAAELLWRSRSAVRNRRTQRTPGFQSSGAAAELAANAAGAMNSTEGVGSMVRGTDLQGPPAGLWLQQDAGTESGLNILVISALSPNLDRSDFERSQPSGRELAWTMAGQFVQGESAISAT